MLEKEFRELIKNNKYQVFLYSSPLPIPVNFAIHTWLVTIKKGKVTRWEGWQSRYVMKKDTGYVYKNLFSNPKAAMNMFPFPLFNIRWKSSLIDSVEGPEAKKIITFLENNF